MPDSTAPSQELALTFLTATGCMKNHFNTRISNIPSRFHIWALSRISMESGEALASIPVKQV